MNELINILGKTISSKFIAEITGKQHSDVMRDIRNLIDQLGDEKGECSFALSSYFGENGKHNPMYELTKKEALLLASGYNAGLRLKIINRLEELETAIIVPSYQIEDPIARAKAWIIEKEEVLMLQEKNEKLQYRSDFLDICFDADGVFKFDEVAKILKLGYGSITLYEKMRKYGLIMKGTTIPYQKYINNGYFKVYQELLHAGTFDRLISVTYATSKGIGYIKKLLDQNEKK